MCPQAKRLTDGNFAKITELLRAIGHPVRQKLTALRNRLSQILKDPAELLRANENCGCGGEEVRPRSANASQLDTNPLRESVLLGRAVALASARFERGAIEDRNPAPAVAKNAALLELLSEQGYGCAAHTEHFGEKFLGQQ